MYASLTSAVTFLGIPGTAYSENIALIIVCIMSRIVAPFILLLFTASASRPHEYIEKRFGPSARYGVAGLFILARLGWLGTVVYAPSMAMSIVTGIPLWSCICMMGLLGGLAASVPATLWLQKAIEAHWIYYFPFSFFIAFLTALIASRFFKAEPKT